MFLISHILSVLLIADYPNWNANTMVEFGLKLADNKVEEWAHAYIDYEALKRLIVAAQKAEKVRDELEAKNRSLAEEIRIKIGNEEASNAIHTDSEQKLEDLSLPRFDGDESETVSLLSYPDANSHHYGGTPSNPSSVHGSNVNLTESSVISGKPRSNSEVSLTSLSVMEKVSGYFTWRGYEHKLTKAIKAENEAIQKFRRRIYEEVSFPLVDVDKSIFASSSYIVI